MSSRILAKSALRNSAAVLLGSLVSVAGFVGTAQAQEAVQAPLADGFNLASRGEIVVIGTKRSGVDPLDAPAPIDVLSADDLENTGSGELSEALRKLTPSFSLPSSPTGGFASSISVGAALRGLSSDQVLVLVNGRRRHTGANFTRQGFNGGRGSAAVDLSLIPTAAIARVEVLKDGAAAQYGSDAIAGVINIVLRSDDEGGSIGYRWSETEKYGGEQHVVNFWKGFSLANGGFLNLAGSFTDRDLTNNTDPDPRRFYNRILVDGVLVDDPREATSPYRNWAFGTPEINKHFNITANGELPLTESLSLYGFGTWATKDTVGLNFYEFPNSSSPINQSPYFKERFPDGRIPTNLYYLDDFSGTLGLKYGRAESGQLDFYANFGRNILDSWEGNGINPSYGPDSPSVFNTGKRKNSQFNAALDYLHEIDVGLPSPLTLSAGAAYRYEEYELIAGDPIAYTRGPFFNDNPNLGPIVPGITYGLTDQDERKISRNVFGAYVSIEAEVLEGLELGFAARAEDYSDFGGTTTVKGTARYEITDTLAIRGSAGTGYRAPSLVQLGFSAYSFQTDTSGPVPVDVLQRTLLPDSEAARLLGGKPLTPEKSTNFSAGAVWQPAPNASLTIDAYQIDIDDRIQLSENLSKASGLLAPLIGTPYESLNSAAFFTNVLDTRTRGIEVSGKYDWELGPDNRISFNLGFSLNETKITGAKDVVNEQGTVIPAIRIVGRSTRGGIEESAPRDKLVGNVDWTGKNLNVGISARYYGEYTSRVANTATANDQTFSPQIIADLNLGYKFGGALSGFKLTGGIQNIFESYPDYIDARGTSTTKHSFNAPEGFYGRVFYTGATYTF